MLKRVLIFVLLAGLLLCSGCTKPADPTEAPYVPTQPPATEAPTKAPTEGTEPPTEVPTEAPTEAPTDAPTEAPTEGPVDWDASLTSLRQAMVGTSQLFAVAYFGYHDTFDSDAPVDPLAVMEETAPQLCENLPFLLQIPKDRIIGENGELFCIVPLDTDATVAVSGGTWDDENEQYIYDDMRYSSENGEPILLFCNNSGWEPDLQLYISGPSGEVFWYPQTDDTRRVMPLEEDLFFDFTSYRELLVAEYGDLKLNAEWEGVLPTEEDLIGKTWTWFGTRKDGLEIRYSVTFEEDYLTVHWYDGIDPVEHIYENALWDVTHEDGYAVLYIDFEGFAGMRRYNLLYSQFYGDLYVALDVLQEDLPIGWEPLYRYLVQPIAPAPVEMVGSWELAWTEIEGYREAAEPGCTLEITTNSDGNYWINFADYAFPDTYYTDKELVIFPFEMYYGCGNDQWTATVNYTGKFDTEYRLTMLYDGTLILQRYFEVEGAPMVSYGCYHRVYS